LNASFSVFQFHRRILVDPVTTLSVSLQQQQIVDTDENRGGGYDQSLQYVTVCSLLSFTLFLNLFASGWSAASTISDFR
jgi:hypothetical protein